MDPFSITAGVAGLVTLISQAVKLAARFTHGVTGASQQATTMIEALLQLEKIFKSLKLYIDSTSSVKGPMADGEDSLLHDTVQSCHRRIDDITQRIYNAARGGRVRILKWPFDKKDHEETLRDIRMFCQWIQLALTIDNNELLSKTLNAVNAASAVNDQYKEVLVQVQDSVGDLTTSDHNKQRDDLLDWLSDLEPSQTHQRVSTNRVEGTCQWFLHDDRFVNWRHGDPKLLIAHGAPGCGKTILTSIVIDSLSKFSNNRIALAYFYFDHAKAQKYTAEEVAFCLIKQICQYCDDIPNQLTHMLRQHRDKRSKPSLKDLYPVSRSVFCAIDHTYVVFDAIDECEESHRKRLLTFFKDCTSHSNAKVFLSCRSHLVPIISVDVGAIIVEIQAHSSDLELSISTALDETDLLEVPFDFQQQLTTRLTSNANGMFLLPMLQLRQVLQEPTIGEMHDALERLPADLHETFEITLQRIRTLPTGKRRIGISTLLWITQAQRPLRMPELQEALAVRAENSILDRNYSPAEQTIIEACMGLIMLDQATSEVHMIHQTVREHVRERQYDSLREETRDLETLCLTYLLLRDFESGPCRGGAEKNSPLSIRLEQHPFYSYASVHWSKFFEGGDEVGQDRLERILHSPPNLQAALQGSIFLQGYREEYWCADEARSTTPLHVACRLGCVEVIKRLLQEGADVNATTKVCKHTPVHHAVAKANIEILRLVLDYCPDLYRCNWYGTPLHNAAEAGNRGHILLLLSKGMPIDQVEMRHGRTSLHCAVQERQWATETLLLEHGADPNARDFQGRSPIHYLHYTNYKRSVDLIKGYSKRRRFEDDDHSSDFESDHTELVFHDKLELNAQDNEGNTPLHMAIINCDGQLTMLLIAFGADYTIKNKEGLNAKELIPSHEKELARHFSLTDEQKEGIVLTYGYL